MAKRTSKGMCQKREVVVGEQKYESITAFCNAYGLKYPATSVLLRKGVEPETIIANAGSLPTTTRYKPGAKTAIPCSYNGVDYPSITAAADALGIPSHRIPACMKARKCSASEAIKYLMEEADEYARRPVEDIGAKRPCTINGVLYSSQAAACKAYGVRAITVYSRMSREGISFEEALASGGVARKHVKPMIELWEKISLSPFTPTEDGNILLQIADALTKTGLEVNCLYDASLEVAAVKIEASLHAVSDFREVYILLPYPSCPSITDVEFILPCLCQCNSSSMPQKMRILDKINVINTKYAGACLSMVDKNLRVSSAATQSGSHLNIRVFLRNFHRFLGTAAAMYDDCVTMLDKLV